MIRENRLRGKQPFEIGLLEFFDKEWGEVKGKEREWELNKQYIM